MAGSLSSSLRCEDGTEISFDWVYPDAAEHEWLRDRAHWPDPLTPMEAWILENGWAGADRAWAEAGMEAPAMFQRFQLVGPFQYVRMSPDATERVARIAPAITEAARRHGNALGFWKENSEPRIQRVCAEFATMDVDVPLRSIAEAWSYAFHQTFTSLVLLFIPNLRLTALLTEVAGDDATLLVHEVTQGGENASQMIDSEIWELAALAKESPAVARLLRSPATAGSLAALRAEPDADEFVAAFDALIARHGSRSQGWEISLPTWRERPEAALALIRAQLDPAATSPAELTERSAAARHEATARALSLLPPEKHAEFHEIVAELDGYVSIREGRAYWQMMLMGELRGLLFRRGAALVACGRIDRADDVLYLVPVDFEQEPATDLRSIVGQRRRDWERWRQVIPPPVIGTPAPAPAAPMTAPNELRGAAASRGEATGRARVITGSPQDADLHPGEILVCVMTTPAWTPLFSIAAGIVTETGGPLSHPAITAREYGIPAVLAVPGATANIRNGQVVTVDGARGVVVLHDG